MRGLSCTRRPWLSLVLLVFLLSACGRGTTESSVYGWKATSHEAATVTLIVMSGPADAAISGKLISESATEVVVAARVRLAGGSQNAMGVLREVQVELKEPIGARSVVNRDGSVVPERP